MVTDIWAFSDRALAIVDLTGFDVRATDGRVGSVVRSMGESGSQHLIVAPQPPLPGDRRMIVPAGLIDSVDTDARRIHLNRSQNDLRNAPSYEAARGLDEAYRSDVASYFAPSRGPMRTARPAAGATPSRSRSRARSQGRPRAQSRPRSQSRFRSTSRSRSQTHSTRRRGREEPTKDELYEEAKRLDIQGRSKMSKAELSRAVGRARGRGGRRTGEARGGRSRARANPVDVQAFLEGVKYPTERGQLLRQAKREGANQKVRSTIEQLPARKKFKDPTAVSKAIGNLR
jgi:hypothetical protein